MKLVRVAILAAICATAAQIAVAQTTDTRDGQITLDSRTWTITTPTVTLADTPKIMCGVEGWPLCESTAPISRRSIEIAQAPDGSIGVGTTPGAVLVAPRTTDLYKPEIAVSTTNLPATPPLIIQPSSVKTYSFGEAAGEALQWLVLVVGPVLAAVGVKLALNFLKKMGIDVSETQRARLQEMVENGLSLAAQRAQQNLKGTMTVEVRNDVANAALSYVQDHGTETLRALGFDPNDPKAIEALQARIAKALDDKAPPPGPPAPVTVSDPVPAAAAPAPVADEVKTS